ncbi:MAG: TonB-dependent receptor plug domain-containing protein, partial [Psychroflexus sp.]|nr:TonB-dependent receptor plug domain-containing protein [Psychroflexus sp.]
MYKFILLCFCCMGVATAQESIKVAVSSQPEQKPISGLTIELVNESRGISIVKTTDQKGNVNFTSLPVIDDYQVKFAGNDDYLSSRSGLIDLRSNESVSITLPVFKKLGEQKLDEVVITDRKSLKINRRNAEVSFELQSEELKKLPVEARDINTALFRLPNVTQATGFFPEAPPVSINGANSLYTNYTIDGMDNNEQFLGGMRFNIPVGFVKDITVLTSNYSAEYGLSNNGVIDITTKSG